MKALKHTLTRGSDVMTKKKRAFFIWFALTLAMMTVAAGPPETDFRDVMGKETAQQFSEISAPGKDLMEQIWDRVLASGAPPEIWPAYVARLIRVIHEGEYGEDGRQEGEQARTGCGKVVDTAMYYQYTSSITGSYCVMDSMNVSVSIALVPASASNSCSNCTVTLASVSQPQQHGYYTAFGRHLWRYPSGGRTSFDAGQV